MLTARHAGVLGSPISHSLSPVLHRAAYAALGLEGWTYDAARVEAAGLVEHVSRLGDDWVGLSLTMPLKEAAFAVAGEVSAIALATGAVNTLVRRPAGGGGGAGAWWGDNTDVHGLVAALGEAGVDRAARLLVVGSGATARSAVAAASALGAGHVTFMVRGQVRPVTLLQARTAGLVVEQVAEGEWPADVDVVVSTVPPASTAAWADRLPPGGRAVLDVVYADGPTPLTTAAGRLGYAAVPGTAMLLHQAARQVELMTGRPAPVDTMRQALDAALTTRATAPTPAVAEPER
ncbi:shikimate dehydrogenase [Dermatophilaceae bacterium Soc4.6]